MTGLSVLLLKHKSYFDIRVPWKQVRQSRHMKAPKFSI